MVVVVPTQTLLISVHMNPYSHRDILPAEKNIYIPIAINLRNYKKRIDVNEYE